MNYQSDCLCGGECQKPCAAIKQIKEELEYEKRYKVTGDHAILARPDKYNLSREEAEELVKELERLNYENILTEEQ